MVAGGLAAGGVAAPAPAGHPLMAVARSIGVDGHQADILPPEFPAAVDDALYAGAEGNVVFLGHQQVGQVACIFQLLHYCGGDLACVAPFVVMAVRRAFAGEGDTVPKSVSEVNLWLQKKMVHCEMVMFGFRWPYIRRVTPKPWIRKNNRRNEGKDSGNSCKCREGQAF
ncbi:MAG: hypothetical protein ACI3ZT_02585 [Candidatus Cryptobacteroides sp.]